MDLARAGRSGRCPGRVRSRVTCWIVRRFPALPCRWPSDDSGAVAVEFALIGFTLFVMLFGAVELGRYHITAQSLQDLAAEGARLVLLNAVQVQSSTANGTLTPPAITAATLRSTLATNNPTPFLSVLTMPMPAISTATSTTGVSSITVTLTYPFQFNAPLLPTGALVLAKSATLSY